MSKLRPFGKFAGTQRGAATLLIALVLLIAATLIVLTGARTIVNEQQLAANDARARQALVAAQAGIDHAVAARASSASFDEAVEELQDPYDIGSGAYRVRFCNRDARPGACPATPEALVCEDDEVTGGQPLLIYSCGWSDDRAARRPVTMISTRLDSFGGGTALPLVTRSAADLMEGNANIYNYFNDLTVWSGDSFLGQAMTGNTYIRDISEYPSPDPDFDLSQTGSCNNPPEGYICSSQGGSVGHDVVVADTNLANLSDGEFFAAFMGSDMATFKGDIASMNIEGSNVGEINGIQAESVWIDGDANLGGTYGSRDEPVILVVDGDLSLGSNAVIHGIVYVTGDMSGNGTPKIFGSLMVGGSAKASGTLSLVYDPAVMNNASRLGVATGNPGTWKDWVAE